MKIIENNSSGGAKKAKYKCILLMYAILLIQKPIGGQMETKARKNESGNNIEIGTEQEVERIKRVAFQIGIKVKVDKYGHLTMTNDEYERIAEMIRVNEAFAKKSSKTLTVFSKEWYEKTADVSAQLAKREAEKMKKVIDGMDMPRVNESQDYGFQF